MTWVVRHGGTELAVWCRMWRVRFPDGWLSEMVKITRAKDAAASTALALLNRSGDARAERADGVLKSDWPVFKTRVAGSGRHRPAERCATALPSGSITLSAARLNAFYCPGRMTSTMRMFVGSTSTT